MQMHISSPSEQAAGAGGAAEPPRGQANYFMSNLISGTQTFHSQRSAGERKSFSAAPQRLFLIRRQSRKKEGWDLTPWWPAQSRASTTPSPGRGARKNRNSLCSSRWEKGQAGLLKAKDAIAPSHSNSNPDLSEDGRNKLISGPEVRFGVGGAV